MRLLPRSQVEQLISKAISERQILDVEYCHVDDGELVRHTLAPFDIGSTNPKTQKRYTETLFAYCYTHNNKKTNQRDPRVLSFNINNFANIVSTGEMFDENELANAHKLATRYDYRTCKFALLPNRDWFGPGSAR